MATTKSKPTKPSEVNDRRSKAPVKTIAKERSSTTEQTDHEVRKMLSLSSIMLGLVIFLAISNLVLAWYAVGRKVEVIAGINLPMLIRLAKARGCMDLAKATVAARDAGRNYITIASEFLGQDA